MKDIQEAFQLIDEDQYEEAYSGFTSLIDQGIQLEDAHYSRAVLDISKLKKYQENTLMDFLFLKEFSKKYRKVAYSFLALVYADLEDYEEVIKYGRLALNSNTPLYREICFVMARALTRIDMPDFEEALVMINNCIACEKEDEEDDDADYYYCKVEILTALARYDEAEKILSETLNNFGYRFLYYYLKGRIYLEKYEEDDPKEEYLEDAISNFTIALQYDASDFLTIRSLVEAYREQKKYQEALDLLDKVMDKADAESIMIEKIKIYTFIREFQKAIDDVEVFLQTHDSWKLKYFEALLLLDIDLENKIEPTDPSSNIKKAVQCLKAANQEEQNPAIALDIVRYNRLIDCSEDNYTFLKESLEKKPYGMLFYLLAETILEIGGSLEEAIYNYKEAYISGYLDEEDYYKILSRYEVNNERTIKYLHQIEKKLLKGHSFSDIRFVISEYLYGVNNYEPNIKKAASLMGKLLKRPVDSSCTIALHGRILELQNNHLEAFKKYQEAMQKVDKKDIDGCDCALGYYAYSKTFGIGTNKDLEEAKKTILDDISTFHRRASSHNIYLYAYFCLSGDERFAAEKAKKLLESNLAFDRLDISRLVFLKQICQKLNQNSQRLDDLMKDFSYYNQDEISYYEKNKDQKLPIPYWRNV